LIIDVDANALLEDKIQQCLNNQSTTVEHTIPSNDSEMISFVVDLIGLVP